MLGKLLKHDLKRTFSWMWILSVVTIGACLLTRLMSELNNGSSIFEILTGFFVGITTALVINVLLQPFIRYFATFQKDFYGDESYLTHTLPVTKNELLYSRYLSSTIQTFAAIAIAILSFFILYWSPAGWKTFTESFGMVLVMNVSGIKMSVGVLILLVFLILITWVLAATSIGYMSIIISSKFKSHKNLCAVILAIAIIYGVNFLAAIISIIIMAISGINFTAEMMPASALIILLITVLTMQIVSLIVSFFVSKHLLNKGVNVD